MRNLGLFQNRINLMRILFMNELYQKTLNITETCLNLDVDEAKFKFILKF